MSAPFNGQLRFETTLEGDRLLVEDDSAVILQIPLRLRDRSFLKQGQRAIFIPLGHRNDPGKTVRRIFRADTAEQRAVLLPESGKVIKIAEVGGYTIYMRKAA